jgi:hypothetical protein
MCVKGEPSRIPWRTALLYTLEHYIWYIQSSQHSSLHVLISPDIKNGQLDWIHANEPKPANFFLTSSGLSNKKLHRGNTLIFKMKGMLLIHFDLLFLVFLMTFPEFNRIIVERANIDIPSTFSYTWRLTFLSSYTHINKKWRSKTGFMGPTRKDKFHFRLCQSFVH